MSIQLRGVAGNIAAVTADGLQQVQTPTDVTKAGFVLMADGDNNPIETTESGALLTSDEGLVFFDQVDGSNVNINKWSQTVSALTIVQASGFIGLNAGLATTANGYAILNSVKSIPMYGPLPLRILISAKVSVIPQSNVTMEIGIGAAATNAAPTDGVFFRWAPNGNFLAVVNNAGAETTSGNITPAPTANVLKLFEIIIVENLVRFVIDDDIVAEIVNPVGIAFPTNAGRLPILVRVYNSSSVPAQAPAIYIGQAVIVQQDMRQNKSWGEVLTTIGNGAYQLPVNAFGQTANHVNSTSPTSATLSNTAAGYTTLGGRYQFAAVAAAATDFALFAFQVPAGYQLFITNVRITAINTGATAGATGTVLDWSLGVNASAVSLATADGAGTWAPRRMPLGTQGIQGLTLIGATASDITSRFDPPLVVDGGRYLHVILQVPVGLATVSQIIRGDVLISGYFE